MARREEAKGEVEEGKEDGGAEEREGRARWR